PLRPQVERVIETQGRRVLLLPPQQPELWMTVGKGGHRRQEGRPAVLTLQVAVAPGTEVVRRAQEGGRSLVLAAAGGAGGEGGVHLDRVVDPGVVVTAQAIAVAHRGDVSAGQEPADRLERRRVAFPALVGEQGVTAGEGGALESGLASAQPEGADPCHG